MFSLSYSYRTGGKKFDKLYQNSVVVAIYIIKKEGTAKKEKEREWEWRPVHLLLLVLHNKRGELTGVCVCSCIDFSHVRDWLEIYLRDTNVTDAMGENGEKKKGVRLFRYFQLFSFFLSYPFPFSRWHATNRAILLLLYTIWWYKKFGAITQSVNL